MAGINIRYDGSDLLRFADAMRDFGDELPAACARALNRTGDMVATQMGRTLAEETGLGVRDIRSDFEIEKASPDNLECTVTVPSRQTTLGEFDPRRPRRASAPVLGASGGCSLEASRSVTKFIIASGKNAIRSHRSTVPTSPRKRPAEQPPMSSRRRSPRSCPSGWRTRSGG